MNKLLWLLFFAICLILGPNNCLGEEKRLSNVNRLVVDSTKKKMIEESFELKHTVSGNVESWDYANPLLDSDLPDAMSYIKSRVDYTSYHLLMALRKFYPASYKKVANEVKAGILCSTLKNTRALNDWGYLEPSGDDESAKALLETGNVALECLVPILGDDSPAPLFGSKEATVSHVYGYRRKDFAYRYAALILGKSPVFRRDPKDRDKDIEALKAELKTVLRKKVDPGAVQKSRATQTKP